MVVVCCSLFNVRGVLLFGVRCRSPIVCGSLLLSGVCSVGVWCRLYGLYLLFAGRCSLCFGCCCLVLVVVCCCWSSLCLFGRCVLLVVCCLWFAAVRFGVRC